MIRFGIVGFGRIGKRHAVAISDASGGSLTAIADEMCENAPDGVSVYCDYKAMLENEALDVVCVCSPNGFHSDQAILALESGAHVICEKPLALSSDAARRMADTASTTNKHLVCVLQNRYSPQASWLKDIVSKNKLGRVLQVQVNCFWNRDKRYYMSSEGEQHPWHGKISTDGGPLFTQFSHFVDLLIWLFGDIEVQGATFRNFTHGETIEFEDAGKFDFGFGEDGLGSFHYSTAVWDKNQESSITIVGSSGSIRLGGQYMNVLEYFHFQGEPEQPDFANEEETGTAGNHQLVIQNMIDALQGKSPLHFPMKDAVKGVEFIEEVYSHRSL